MNTKEMYEEIAVLLGAVAKAFDLSDQDAAKGLEDGRITLQMAVDQDGQRFVRATHQGRGVRIYDGRVYYEDTAYEDTGAEPDDDGCGGGCSCGR